MEWEKKIHTKEEKNKTEKMRQIETTKWDGKINTTISVFQVHLNELKAPVKIQTLVVWI